MIQHPTSWFRWLTGSQTASATPCADNGWYENDASKNADRNKRCLHENILSASYSSHDDGILLNWWNHLPQLRWAEKKKSLDDNDLASNMSVQHQLLINALPGQVGPGTRMDGNATYEELKNVVVLESPVTGLAVPEGSVRYTQIRVMALVINLLAVSLPASSVVRAQELAPWYDPSKHKIQFITVEDGVRLEVLDWGGSGRPVVLLAGLGFTAHVFDDFAEKLAESCHVYGITRRGYGASSRPLSGYTEERLAEDDLRVFDALRLVAPVVAGHSVAGGELSQLGIHHFERIGGLVYFDALNDGSDDWADYDALSAKLPKEATQPRSPSPADMKSFAAYRAWRMGPGGVAVPEAEWRNDFAENPDGSVGSRITPGYVPQAIMAGDHQHDYSQIRVPVLAFVGYPPPPPGQRESHIADFEERAIVYAVFGSSVALIRNRIKRINAAAGGAHVVDMWGASHLIFLSNESDVLREIRVFLAGLS